MKDLLAIHDLTSKDLLYLLKLATELKSNPHKYNKEFIGDTIALYFTKPSTRTRISFETAAARLGAIPIVLHPIELQLHRGETIKDTIKAISRYCKALVVRINSDKELKALASEATIPVINGLTDHHHPCQSLADMLTIQEIFGDLKERKIGYIGDGNNVANSLMEAAALLGVNITLATPKNFEPSREIVENAQKIAKTTGAKIIITNDVNVAAEEADAIYTDTWISMGVPEAEYYKRIEVFKPFQVNGKIMKKAKPTAIFMHCLPGYLGQEVTADVLYGDQSVVFDQAENRLHTAVALLYALNKSILEGKK